jgi:polysaccharide deacetylase family protein (PEP-CTERM system associated)
MKNNFFLTLDLEDWYHLDYFQKYPISKKTVMLNSLSPFFDLLDKYQIKITVFVLGELIKENHLLIKNISDRGHEIAIHGWDHLLLHNKSNEEFSLEILRAKNALEELINKPVIGYRAPCFSLNNEKLEELSKLGLKYDSSYILFKDHPLYGKLNVDTFKKVDDLIYMKNRFYEFELPTISILNKQIPISGGGYFRLFPKMLFKILWKKYLKNHHNFNLYIHPFELTESEVDLSQTSKSDSFRFSIGRKGNLNKLEWLIKLALKSNFSFSTINDWIENYENNTTVK